MLRNPGEGYFRLHFNFDFLFLKLNYLGGGAEACSLVAGQLVQVSATAASLPALSVTACISDL